MAPASAAVADPTRQAARRFFNLFRLTVAGLLLVAGREVGLGEESPALFSLLALIYTLLALLLGLPWISRQLRFERLVAVQFSVDVIALSLLMWLSGGYASGMAVLIMVYLAAAGLLAEGRMVLFFAALATLAVLLENAWRVLAGLPAADFLPVALVCIGFFAIALTARLLASRARASETLAEARGQALGRQQVINERIIEDMRDGVLVVSADGRLRQANPRAAELLGVRLEPDMHLAEVDAALSRPAELAEEHGSRLHRLGPARKLLRCRPVNAGSGDPAGEVVLYLTDFEEIQQQIQQHKLAALGRLTASMAHEIRNPLSSVSHAAELLADERRAEVQARLTQIITDNARRIERLVREVLALGRRDEVVREPLSPAQMIADIVEELALDPDAGTELFWLDVPAELRMLMDRAHFHQILSNLLSNALRHCSRRPGAIQLYAYEVEGGVALHVCDDGPGIAAARRERVFEPFFTTDPKGTGLGLYIARELAEANDARLELRPSDVGAHFVLIARSQA